MYKPHIAEPEIVVRAGAFVGRDERDAALRRRIGVGDRPRLPAVVGSRRRVPTTANRTYDSSGDTASEHRPLGKRQPAPSSTSCRRRSTDVTIVAADVDDPAVVDQHVAYIVGAIGGRWIDEGPVDARRRC